MANDLWAKRNLEPNDVYQAMPIIVRQINDVGYKRGLVHKDNPERETLVNNCWDTDENIYARESLDTLWTLVKEHAFDWCVTKLNSMK
jgi:ribulose bisphosphate carboxylase small subunit